MKQVNPHANHLKWVCYTGKGNIRSKPEFSHHSGKGVSALATKKKAPARKKAAKKKAPARKKAAKKKAPARKKAAKKKAPARKKK